MADESAATGEFEREPVPEHALLGLKSFVGQYAGEHVAGTELMIGPMFLAAGVSAFDLVVGLLVGNALAVVSWMVLCAPIATRARLTLYFQLERICGRRLVTLYNIANGVMFCFLAGSMITVSTTAVGVWFDVDMPKFSDVLPGSVSWVVMSAVVGASIAIVAAFGYRAVSKFANVAAPWMVLVFLAFGIIGLKQMGVTSLGDFWHVAETRIWKGGAPLAGHAKFGFWHICFFAWFCNLAMHVGMADLSVFRFARKSWYAISAAAGMYVGHFMAWICASVLFAVQLAADPKNTDVLPGPMADRACGTAGLLCVIFAGWTTANPTIYRAGLAFQAIVPRWPRFTVTLVTGAIATIAGVFPAVAMQLLGFVALYGMLLMPMGAVIFVDFWLLERLGMESWYAQCRGLVFNWAAALTWFLTLAACFALHKFAGLEVFFISLPGWFVAALLYVVLSKIWQRRTPAAPRTAGAAIDSSGAH